MTRELHRITICSRCSFTTCGKCEPAVVGTCDSVGCNNVGKLNLLECTEVDGVDQYTAICEKCTAQILKEINEREQKYEKSNAK